MFEALGAVIFDADREAKRIMAEDPAVRQELIAAFGPAVYAANGELQRRHLASQVFNDEAALRRIGFLAGMD